MDEFITNFNTFKDWLKNYESNINPTTEGISVYQDIKGKFQELNLEDAF